MIKEFIINDPKIAKVFLNPLRHNIWNTLRNLGKGSSTDISKILNLPPSNVAYHIKLLEKSGLIVFVEEKKVKNLVEKIYEPVAENITTHLHNFNHISEFEEIIDNSLRLLKIDFLKNENDADPLAFDKGISYQPVHIKKENLIDFINDYNTFVEKYKTSTEGSTPYKLGIIYIKDV